MKYGSSIIVTGTRFQLSTDQVSCLENILSDVLVERAGTVFVSDSPTGVDQVVRDMVEEYNWESSLEDRWDLQVISRNLGQDCYTDMVGACLRFREENFSKDHYALAVPGKQCLYTWSYVQTLADEGIKVAVVSVNALDGRLAGSLEWY